MSNLGPSAGRRPPTLPTLPQGRIIARYPTYELAQRAVDFLSDNRLPVQAVTIIGTDLRTVERVTGRLTYGRVALQGAISGAWFGLLIGILLSFAEDASSGIVGTAIVFGAAFGMLFALIGYAMARGRRDFTSRSQIVAGEYHLLCQDELVRQAGDLLAQLPTVGAPVNLPPPALPPPPVPSTPTPSPYLDAGRQAPPPSPWGETAGGFDVAGAAPQDAPRNPADPPVPVTFPTGLTYGEMIDRRKRERLERERAEHEASHRAGEQQRAREQQEDQRRSLEAPAPSATAGDEPA